MRQLETIELENYYHIYNRGINGEDLFCSKDNHFYFLNLYKKHISPIAETFAWCLMKNHFHFLVRIKSEEELSELYKADIEKLRKKPSQHFSNFFNAYAQAINKQKSRHGSLFEKPFRRRKVTEENYLMNIILYIHNNPINHNISNNIEEYQWSSYNTFICDKETAIMRAEVLNLFGGKANFIEVHKKKVDKSNMKNG